MATIQIRKGKDIKLKGAAEKKIIELAVPSLVAITPADFRGIKPKVLVKPDEVIKVGSPILEDKTHPDIKIVSPVSGKVVAVNRGEKRVLLDIVIQPDGRQEAIACRSFNPEELKTASRENIIKHILEGGVWPCLRQRPFSKMAHPEDTPKAIFIQAMNTEPLAVDVDFILNILNNREAEFQAGLDILKKLTSGAVHLCCSDKAGAKALTQAKNVEIHRFAGPHPAGNVSTHIHHIDPIKRGEVVWYVQIEDVLRVAQLFLQGRYSPERFVAVTGEGAPKKVYVKTVIGAQISHLLQGSIPARMRCISGSVLTGATVSPNGFLGYYDSQITVIPEGGNRKFLGWLDLGFHAYSFSKTYLSSLQPADREVSLDTDKHGSNRAIVYNHLYDDYVPLDIMTFFLLRAVMGGDIEEAEKLGILECDEEDFALCSFACPSKTDVGGIIRRGLDLIEKEG